MKIAHAVKEKVFSFLLGVYSMMSGSFKINQKCQLQDSIKRPDFFHMIFCDLKRLKLFYMRALGLPCNSLCSIFVVLVLYYLLSGVYYDNVRHP